MKVAKEFLNSLTLDKKCLITVASVDPMGNEYSEDAVQKTHESYYNEYFKKKISNKNTYNALTGSINSTAGDSALLITKHDSKLANSYNNFLVVTL